MTTKLDWSVLSGPHVSRRTMMRLALVTGAVPFASWLAACGGDDDDDDPTATAAAGGGEATNTPGSAATDPTATSGSTVSGTAAAATPTTSGEAQTGGELTIGFGALQQILTLDPAMVTQGIVAGQLISNLFSSLVQFDENLGLVADLAEDWTVSEDGTEYNFTLREGLTFHNGDPLVAEDFVYTYERTTSEALASPHANKLSLITEITAVDDLTLQIVLSDPFAPFLAVACSRGPGRALTPIPRSVIEEIGDEQFGVDPVGCGPFMYVAGTNQGGQGFEMVAFENWYGGRPYLDKIIIEVIPDPTSQVSALEAGDIDMLNLVPDSGLDIVMGNDELTLVEAPGTNWSGLTMNYTRPPWDQLDARMAVAKAIDRQGYVDTAFFGIGTPGHSAIAPAFGWVYHADPGDDPQAFNLDEAKALAESAGVTGLTVNIMALSDDPRTREVIRTQLAEIGLDVVIEPLQSAALNERWMAGDFDLHINGSVVDADPDDGHFNFFYSEGPWNVYGYNSPEADRLIDLTRTTSDIEERKQAWLDLERVLQEDVAYAFLVHTPDQLAFYNYVQGYRPIPEIRHLEVVWRSE